MGLDNIPHIYPCRHEQSAVSEPDGRINCAATIDAGRCPYRRELAETTMTGQEAVFGMLGTWCWYRGKFGQWMLDELTTHDPAAAAGIDEAGFFGHAGDGERGDGPDLSPAYLERLADAMEAAAPAWERVVRRRHREQADELTGNWAYAIWWCRFTARHAGGSDAWF